jgi:hypothetical protein
MAWASKQYVLSKSMLSEACLPSQHSGFNQDSSKEKRFSRHHGWTVGTQLDSWLVVEHLHSKQGSPVQETNKQTKQEPPGFTCSDQWADGSSFQGKDLCALCKRLWTGALSFTRTTVSCCHSQAVMKSYWAFVLWFCLTFQQGFILV